MSYESYSADGSFIEFGIAFKPKFMVSPTVAIKPGLNIGYRKMETDESSYDAEGLGLNASVEIQFQVKGMLFFIEPGFLSQPAGGNDNTDITFGPIGYINVGVCF